MTTGAGYKVSRNDGRATYFEGQRVDDLAAHEILGQSVEIMPVAMTTRFPPIRMP